MKTNTIRPLVLSAAMVFLLVFSNATASQASSNSGTSSDADILNVNEPHFSVTPQASGKSFTFSTQWGSSLKSRKWTTTKKANIYVKIGKIKNCSKNNELTLRKSTGGKVGSVRNVSCSSKTYTWKTVKSGKYYFELVSQASTGGRLQKSSGKVAYNGAGI